MKKIQFRLFASAVMTVVNLSAITPVASAVEFRFTTLQERKGETVEIENTIEDFQQRQTTELNEAAILSNIENNIVEAIETVE